MERRNRARALRQNATPAERRLWSAPSGRRIAGVRFNRQVLIGDFICDFVARTPGLVVEVDGDSHASQAAYDERRTIELETLGYKVIRFGNADVMNGLEGVVAAIERLLAGLPSPSPSREREGS